jgi:hypothetical protein
MPLTPFNPRLFVGVAAILGRQENPQRPIDHHRGHGHLLAWLPG